MQAAQKLGMAFRNVQRKNVDNMISKLKRQRVKPLNQKKTQEQSYEEQAF